MRLLVACAAGAFLALSIPLGSASAGSRLVQADWHDRPDWHHHWQHEWRDHWRPEWHPDWHHHWHHDEDRPYGYQY
jgi:hypothetical protein